ncbi:hypothetical protein [Frankia nepalensis]|uniref:hypothetical protein n=1 Tax=Frankia nepalensis TaxID=1836974 RepID=UPI0019335B74|nr:hypothetical protein [Frankia nepalensis]
MANRGWQPWPEARDAYSASHEGWSSAALQESTVTGVLTPPGMRIPPPPPVLPPGELDTVTGPISMSGSAYRLDGPPAPAGDHHGYGDHHGHGGHYGYSYEDYLGYAGPAAHGYQDPAVDQHPADGGYPDYDYDFTGLDDAPYDDEPDGGTPSAPAGGQFIAATPAARASLSAAVGNQAIRDARLPGDRSREPHAKGDDARRANGGQRPPGAHRAPAGRPGTARNRLAIMSTASLAGLSALVGTAVLSTDTGPLTIPTDPGGTTTDQWPSARATGSLDSSATSPTPVKPALAPAAPDQSPAGDRDQPSTTAGDRSSFADDDFDSTGSGSTAERTYLPDGTPIPIVPLLPRDSAAAEVPVDLTASPTAPQAAPSSTPSDDQAYTSFDWFGLGSLVDEAEEEPATTAPSQPPTTGQGQPSAPTSTPTTAPPADPGTQTTPGAQATPTAQAPAGAQADTGAQAAGNGSVASQPAAEQDEVQGQPQGSTAATTEPATTEPATTEPTAAGSPPPPADPFVVTSPDPASEDTSPDAAVLDWIY